MGAGTSERPSKRAKKPAAGRTVAKPAEDRAEPRPAENNRAARKPPRLPRPPILQVFIPKDEEEGELHHVNVGANCVAFSPNEMEVLNEVRGRLGNTRSTTTYRPLSARGPPSARIGATSSRGGDLKPVTPLADPKLEKSLSKEVVELLRAFNPQSNDGDEARGAEGTNPHGGSSAKSAIILDKSDMEKYSFNNPLLSTRSMACNSPATTTSQIIKEASKQGEASAGISNELQESLRGFSTHMMPSTVRMLQKLYALKTGLTPKETKEGANGKSINFRSYVAKNGTAPEVTSAPPHLEPAKDDVEQSKEQPQLQKQLSVETFDVAHLLNSPSSELARRRSPRSTTPLASGSGGEGSDHTLDTHDSSVPTTSGQFMAPSLQVDCLMPFPNDLKDQDFEFLVACLPEVPDPVIYSGALVEDSCFNFSTAARL